MSDGKRDGDGLTPPARQPKPDPEDEVNTEPKDELPAGWAFAGQRKAHFFPAASTTSLCGRVGFFCSTARDDNEHNSPDNCAECKRRHTKNYGGKK